MKLIVNILFFFLLNLTQTHAQSIVRTFNSDAFVTSYINGHAYGYDAEIVNRKYTSPEKFMHISKPRKNEGWYYYYKGRS